MRKTQFTSSRTAPDPTLSFVLRYTSNMLGRVAGAMLSRSRCCESFGSTPKASPMHWIATSRPSWSSDLTVPSLIDWDKKSRILRTSFCFLSAISYRGGRRIEMQAAELAENSTKCAAILGTALHHTPLVFSSRNFRHDDALESQRINPPLPPSSHEMLGCL